MNIQRLKLFIGGYVVLGVLLIGLILFAAITTLGEVRRQREFEHRVTEKLVGKLAEAKLEARQVQQYLTDSAATGADDSKEDAAKSLRHALLLLSEVAELDSGLRNEADKLARRIENLHESGLRMLSAYRISQDAGNAIMKAPDGFDQQSDEVAALLDQLGQKVEGLQNAAVEAEHRAMTRSEIALFVLGGIFFVTNILVGMALYRQVFSAFETRERALESAKLADQTKDAFLANISHELRTPLNAVIGMAGLAQGLSSDPKLRSYLDKIVSSGKHLNRIINELLDLSKIAAGYMELEVISFSLRTVMEHSRSVMAHRAEEKGLEIVETIDAAVPDVLLGDPTRIEQILLNLLGNAIKFTDTGRVEVRVSLHVREESRVCIDIEFEDSGIGMRPEELDLLFKPFTQVDTSVTRKYGGTGLGLTISRRLAEMMDGDISVTSVEGSGTTFKSRIWLGLGNAADLPTVEPVADETPPESYRDVRVLVAEDQPLNREIVEALLARVGITSRVAANGQEALDILTQAGPDAFDLVLMDVQMPVVDGLTATRAIRKLDGFARLPIIAMTAHTMAHEKAIGTAAGMNDHIGKPFDNPSFYRTLAKWIPESKQKVAPATEELLGQPEPMAEAGTDLATLRGVDLAPALARFGGRDDRYRHWLGDFVATAGAIPDQMRNEIAAGHPDTAAKTAHAFKGRVGMLGMTDLHGVVVALEGALHGGTATDGLLSALEQSIGEMRDQLTRFLGTGLANTEDDQGGLERVVWNDTYSVGVAEMDEQHKKLVGMINRLADYRADQSAESSGAFHEVLSGMFDYTQVHFNAEEDYLHRIGYPQLAAHEKEHAAFVEKMAAFSMAASDGVQDRAGVHHYLKGWLLSHILNRDMQYRHFIEGNEPKRLL
ncbi:MAG: bacteriohemerythrin [Rhodocyclales bacterium]|nr:bacteriohemerythrin [Rhodocyclales bacterium]